jgi:hypothetical protein
MYLLTLVLVFIKICSILIKPSWCIDIETCIQLPNIWFMILYVYFSVDTIYDEDEVLLALAEQVRQFPWKFAKIGADNTNNIILDHLLNRHYVLSNYCLCN